MRVHVLSNPAGAEVLDPAKGTRLGKTPLDLVQPANTDPLVVLLRLAGFKDKTVHVAREAESSTDVELEPQPAETKPVAANPAEVRPASAQPARKKTGMTVKKAPKDSEEEWRLH